MSNKYIKLLTSYHSGDEINIDKLDLNTNSLRSLRKSAKTPCLEPIEQDGRDNWSRDGYRRVFSPSDGADRKLCSGCREIESMGGGCPDFLESDGKSSQISVEYRILPREGDVDGKLLDLSGKL